MHNKMSKMTLTYIRVAPRNSMRNEIYNSVSDGCVIPRVMKYLEMCSK